MNFTSPAFLWALPLAAAPLLLHLFSLRRARRVSFGDLSLLRQVYARALPRARLRSRLLLAARCLLLFFLILSYAGPMMPSASPGPSGTAAEEEALDLVLLLDASYSMGFRVGGKTRFEAARAAGEELLGALKPADRVAVGVFSDRLEPLSGGALDQWQDKRQALEVLSRAKLGFRATDFGPPLKAARDLLAAAPNRRRAVVLLSDGARHGLRGPLAAEPDISLLALEWPGEAGNGFIVDVRPSPDSSSKKPRLTASVKSFGKEEASVIDVSMEGERVASLAVSLRPDAEQSVSAALPGARRLEAPAWSGQAALRLDALSADDVYFYSFRHARRPKVLCLYGNPDFFKSLTGGYFLKEILGGAGESLLEQDGEFMDLARLGEARLSDYQAVILADFKKVSPAAADELERFVRRGGGLWLLPGTRTETDGFSALDAWLPAHIGAPAASWDPQGLKGSSHLWREFDLQRVSVGRYHKLEPREGAKTWLSSASGDPLLVSGVRGDGRIVVWASSLDTAWSNLGVKPVFAAWTQTILREISPAGGERGELLHLKIGEPLIRVWDKGRAVPARVRVRAPDGRVTALAVRERRVVYAETEQPGIYTLSEDGSSAPKTAYAVNLDRSLESDLTPAEDAPWKTLRAERAREDFFKSLYGRDIRAQTMAAALAFLILELFLALPWSAKAAALSLLLISFPAPARAQQGDRFVWSQLKLDSGWDPYPAVPSDILQFLSTVTSALVLPERRTLTLKDPLLFSSPLVVLTGRQAPPELDEEQVSNLRNYLSGGGMLWIEDASGSAPGSFDRWVRRVLAQVLPESPLVVLEPDHVVFRTFFLARPAGRVMARGSLEGVWREGRTAVIYSRNDLLGAWAKDALGRPLYPCSPGGEAQRHGAKKLTLNILMYSLTGSYKADAVHQPSILQKIRSGIP